MNNALTPSTLGGYAFRVPLYQRPYAWEEAQVRQLMEDLVNASKDTPDSDYHLGILSVAKGDDGVLELIDGQQRMTTLALIAKAAGENWFAGKLNFHGRPKDKAFIFGNDQADCNPRMKQTVAIATEYLNKDAELSGYIFNHAGFFLSEVPPGYTVLDKNQQFVRFNNRGRQLEKHEILKVKLISRLPREDQGDAFAIWNSMSSLISGADFATLDREAINPAETLSLGDILGDPFTVPGEIRAEEPLYRSIVTIPEFLLVALARFASGQDISHDSGKLLETCLAKLDAASKIQRFIALLGRQVELFRKYSIFISKDDGRYVIGRPTSDKERLDWTDGDKQDVIDVQSFLHVSTQPHRWLVEAFDWLELQTDGVSAKAFVSELELNDRKQHDKLPALSEMRFGSAPHYWFNRLDYELLKEWRRKAAADGSKWAWTGLAKEQHHLIDKFRFRPCGSVEHILPQNEMETPGTAEDKDNFGNLALISSSRNSKFSNNPREGKKEIIMCSEYTESLKMLHHLWCEPDVNKHEADMVSILERN